MEGVVAFADLAVVVGGPFYLLKRLMKAKSVWRTYWAAAALYAVWGICVAVILGVVPSGYLAGMSTILLNQFGPEALTRALTRWSLNIVVYGLPGLMTLPTMTLGLAMIGRRLRVVAAEP